jgi:hypothetical protein
MFTLAACLLLAGCMTPPDDRFVEVAAPFYGTQIAVISANEETVKLRISGPNEPVFLAMVEPKVIGDGLYLFPSYINQPTLSERVDVPVVELDLPAQWKDRIYWVEGEHAPRWFNLFAERVRTIQRRHLTLVDPPGAKP